MLGYDSFHCSQVQDVKYMTSQMFVDTKTS